MRFSRFAPCLIFLICFVSALAASHLYAAGTETLLQKMKREAGEKGTEQLAPNPNPVQPQQSAPELSSPARVEDHPAAQNPVFPQATRPARPLEWPPERYIEIPSGDEGQQPKDFKTLRVPLGEVQPNDGSIKKTVTFKASGREDVKQTPLMSAAPSGPVAARVDDKSYAGYILGPGDKLKITVFGEPDLSGDFTVNDAGQLSYPLVGEVSVTGLTVLRVKEKITGLLREGYLRDPNLAIEVAQFRPFYITGEVRAPGSYSYVADMSIMNAIVLAGGFTFRADQDGVEISRATASGTVMLEDQDPQGKVVPGDIITVKERFF